MEYNVKNKDKIKLVAFDLDGTLTQHKTPISDENRKALDLLAEKYTLLAVGAGGCQRIFKQLNNYPLDIIGNYGLQYFKYDADKKDIYPVRDVTVPINKDEIEKRVDFLRKEHNLMDFVGDSVQYHDSGCVTFAILGTKAELPDKLAFDPDRKIRRAFYDEVVEMFPEYNVFVGGSSSFDMAPKPYNKYNALKEYIKEKGLEVENVVFIGDDYGIGGNDESVFVSEFQAIKTDDYREFYNLIKNNLL